MFLLARGINIPSLDFIKLLKPGRKFFFFIIMIYAPLYSIKTKKQGKNTLYIKSKILFIYKKKKLFLRSNGNYEKFNRLRLEFRSPIGKMPRPPTWAEDT